MRTLLQGLLPVALLFLFGLVSTPVLAEEPVQVQGTSPALEGCPVLPADNIWNTPVDTLPLDPNSTAYVNTIDPTRRVHADFGAGDWPPGSGAPIGIPYVVVPAGQLPVPIQFYPYGDESDPGPYPVPANAPIEGGSASSGDRHVLVIRQGECKLYELYRAFPSTGDSWNAESGAVYDLNSNALRPAGWTSADAAGLPILPGLVRYEEVAAGEINHALRFTAPQTRRAYVWPARHYASNLTGTQYPPLGQRFRLRANFDVSGYSEQARVILLALKKYGMILADNGSAWYISGAPDERWDNDILHELDNVAGANFEAVDISSLQVDPDSGQVLGFTLAAQPATQAIEAGQAATYRITLAAAASFSAPVTVAAGIPDPSLIVSPLVTLFDPPAGEFTLVVTDTHPTGPLLPGQWYTLPLTATGGGFTRTVNVRLLVGGAKIYLPLVLK